MSGSSFSDFDLAPPIAAALQRLGFARPTPIQAAAIGPQLEGRDLIAIAATGSGKTAAYGLPLLQQLIEAGKRPGGGTCRALVLAPTRELALQIMTSMRAFGERTALRSCLVVGGLPRAKQVEKLADGVDLVVATPGRLVDLMRARAVSLGAVRHLVIDEADRMLDLGFIEPLRSIAAEIPPGAQTAMFSATMPSTIAALAQELMRAPLRIDIPVEPQALGRIAAHAELVAPALKRRRLADILKAPDLVRAVIFCRTRKGADHLAIALARSGLVVGVIHGDRSHDQRRRTLDAFRRGAIPVLVATDIVARGIDVSGVSHVINYDLPEEIEDYVHRIGRTGRAGASGTAISLCTPEELPRLRAIERATGASLLPPTCRRASFALGRAATQPARRCAHCPCRR